ncbi:MAG: major facilitator superfamily domain-containing protein 7 [Clostridiales bacterium]|nr:major facilitator superfamily domain-containing protein 7 [Clostridiales bacterium]
MNGKAISGISPYRWVILFTTVPIIVATEMMWLTFSPIASVMEASYGISNFAVNMLATSYMIMFIIFCIPASYVIDRFGFRTSLFIGALLTGIFGFTRAAFADSFAIIALSQFLLAAGQPFLLNVTTKVAVNWFPFEERATADGILTMAQYLGFAIPMVLSPMLAEQYGISAMLKVFAAVGTAAAVLVLVFSRERPRLAPPGPAAEKEDFSLSALKVLFKNKEYVLALAAAFISIGIFNTILTLIESILMPRGITSAEAGIIGAAFVVAGVLGAIILPIISDKAGKRIGFLVAAIVLLVPLYLSLTFVSSYMILVIIAAVAGFSIMGVAPILFQHSSEVAYPAQEGTSLGMILLMGQISGTLFVFLFEILDGSFGSVVIPMLGLVALTVVEIPIVAKMKESNLVKQKK